MEAGYICHGINVQSFRNRPSVKDITAKELTSYLDVKDVSLLYIYKGKKGDIPVSFYSLLIILSYDG